MISGAVRSFQDPWEHQAFYRGANMKALITTRGQYRSAVSRRDLHRLWIQRNDTALPQVVYLVDTTDRCSVGFTADPQHQPPYRNGDEVQSEMLIVSSIEGDHHFWMPAACQVAAMSLPTTDLASASRALTGRELTVPATTRLVPIPDDLIVRLRRLHGGRPVILRPTHLRSWRVPKLPRRWKRSWFVRWSAASPKRRPMTEKPGPTCACQLCEGSSLS